MERKKNKIDRIFIPIIYIYFFAGVVWHLIPATKEIVVPFTSYGLYIFSILLLIVERNNLSLISILWFLFIVVTTFFIEVIGVKTGKVFGDYTYGNVLGIKILEVPVLIALNWGFVLIGIYSFVNKIKISSGFLKMVLISSVIVLFDFILEPIAIKLNYWYWDQGYVPVQNYFAWFLIALYFSFVGMSFKISINTKYISHYIFAQSIFFIILNIFL